MNEGLKTCGKPSRGRYRQGCRCFMCRAANAQYEYERNHGMRPQRQLVGQAEAEAARKRVEGWREQGIGLRTVELWTGVHRASLQTLLNGKHRNCNGESRRMSRENYEAIMGCEDIRPAPHTPVDSSEARAIVARLLEAGWSKARVSHESGVPYQTLVAAVSDRRGTGMCSAKTAGAISALWDRVQGKGRARTVLEDWQWQEARADYAKGIGAATLAERYGVSEGAVKEHMRRHGVAFAQQAGAATARMWSA